jgi:hypothetical protein
MKRQTLWHGCASTHREKRTRGFYTALVAVLCLWSAPAAHANDYLFSFTTSQVLTALSTTGDYSTNGYFAIFLQPSTGTLPGQQGTPVVNGNPDPSGPDAWTVNSNFYDPSAFNGDDNSFIYFGKQTNQSDVSVINSTESSTFVPSGCSSSSTSSCHTYSDSGGSYGQPVNFGELSVNGGNGAYVTNVISSGATWQFEVATCNGCTLSGSYTFQGYASAIDLVNGWGQAKTDAPISFTINLTPTSISSLAPEPGTWAFMAAGIGLIVFASVWKRRTQRGRSSGTVQ